MGMRRAASASSHGRYRQSRRHRTVGTALTRLFAPSATYADNAARTMPLWLCRIFPLDAFSFYCYFRCLLPVSEHNDNRNVYDNYTPFAFYWLDFDCPWGYPVGSLYPHGASPCYHCSAYFASGTCSLGSQASLACTTQSPFSRSNNRGDNTRRRTVVCYN